MGFNYAKKRAEMEARFVRTRKLCREAGMPESDIEKIYEMELGILNSDRRFYTHTQSYNSASFEDGDAADEARSSLLKKFSGNFSVFQAEISDWGRYDWMDDLDNQMLIRFVQQLPAQDIELLTFLIVDGLNQSDIAHIRNVSSPAISKQKARIRKNLEKFLGDG